MFFLSEKILYFRGWILSFSMIPKMPSLILLFSEKTIFAFLTEGQYRISREKKYHLYQIYRKYHISMYFLRKIIFQFITVSDFRETIPSFLIIGETYSSAALWKGYFSEHWKKIVFLAVLIEVFKKEVLWQN